MAMKLAVLKAPRRSVTLRRKAKLENLSDLLDALDELCATSTSDQVTVREILDAVGRRSWGPLLLVIGLIAISPLTLIPGSTWLVAIITLLFAGQMAIGKTSPWLPERLLKLGASKTAMSGFIARARPLAKKIDGVLRPRLTLLAAPPFLNLIAIFCIAAAIATIVLSFIPLAPAIPSLALILFGLGIAAKDGLILALGMAAMAGAGWLVSSILV